MRTRLVITAAVGFGLILAGAFETARHHTEQHRVSLMQMANVPNSALLSGRTAARP